MGDQTVLRDNDRYSSADELGDKDLLETEKVAGNQRSQFSESMHSDLHKNEAIVTEYQDDVMKLALEAEGEPLTPDADRKLLRKINICMFPLMALLYAVQYMDKVTNGSAAIMGLQEALHMHGEQYSFVGSAFYFGYLVGLFILPPLMQKSKYFMKTTCSFIVIWGVVLALHGAPGVNYAAFIFLRCMLGFFESAITPAFTIITCQYWRKEEHFFYVTCWFGFNGLGNLWGSALAYGLYTHKDGYSIAAWKLVFITTGCITIFVGIMMALCLPDSPNKAWFLKKQEKLQLVERIRSNQQGFGNHKIKKYQVIEALKDIRTWLYFAFSVFSNIPNGGTLNFSGILLKEDFKYNTKDSLLMNMPAGAFELVFCPLFGYLSYYCTKHDIRFLRYRFFWAFSASAIAMIGTCMLAFDNKHKFARLFGFYFIFISPLAFICILSSISSNTLGYTKKWTVSSINLIAYASANLAGPHIFIDKEKPSYKSAKISMVVCYIGTMVVLVLLFILNKRENIRRDKLAEQKESSSMHNIEFNDLTDFENLNFRYML